MAGGIPGELSTAGKVRECTRTHIHADLCGERHGDGRASAFTCVCAYMYMTTHLAAVLPPQRGSPA